ncbi:MAG: purine-nucleoside phosphorylase [Pseudomonadota bacterium]
MTMTTATERANTVDAAVAFLRQARPGWTPKAALVLGSGLGDLANSIEDRVSMDYKDIPGFPTSSVPGHAGRLVTGTLEGTRVAVMQGRVHLYEGFSPDRVVLPVRALRLWGAEDFILTNAAGTARAEVPVGTLVILKDHLNLQSVSCLAGPNPDAWGPRFPDMTAVYDVDWSRCLLAFARSTGIPVDIGIYAAMPGPNYETPAEVSMVATLGADVVGMSTVQEVLALRQMGARILGISCVTNFAAGIGEGLLDHAHVAAAALAVADRFATLVRKGLELRRNEHE